ncbi:Murein DD-endopeptidase MepM and murein hydrolase activator NlpD, contain LysM domain [Limimonas halophila]|uniref:Murein DD-endopeptidase MepM and murein hydrolase activator NlpD, contain LysM domain n=1 Tax=Limimonas halophila TaxID=1082479 RepID=A0A1G7PYS4_9PROT|nr:M23 family metallopeptidase [Limimonas halophila]SDF91373.1 Murein DD-endopeptidase MepM and murein hydrolase activator NlpD, contain LysM domain [Limimonas halophila]
MEVLQRAGIGVSEAYQAARQLQDVYDASALSPGQAVHLRFGGSYQDRRLRRLKLRASAETNAAVVRTDEGGFAARTTKRDLKRRVHAAEGTIRSSLFAAGRRHEVPPKLMITVIRKLSYLVDFQRDLREGDGFEVLYATDTGPDGKRARVGPLLYASVERRGEQLEMYRFDAEGTGVTYFNSEGKSVRRLLMRTPLNGARISSGYGMREHPMLGYSRMHEGVDFAASRGTPIYAAGDGVVRYAGRNGGYGNYVKLDHRDPFTTAYGHMQRVADGVRPGAHVNQGEVIGYVGNTGRSTGPHLHYEILKHGEPVNPRSLDLPTGYELTGQELKAFKQRVAEIDRMRERRGEPTRVAQASCGEAESKPENAC